MARATLAKTISKVRFEAGQSNRMSHGNDRDQIVHLINRVQDQLATQFDWPRRRESATIAGTAGVGTLAVPAPFTFEDIERVTVAYTDMALELVYGIGPEQTNSLALDLAEDRRWPPRRWEFLDDAGTDNVVLWPTPDRDFTLTLEGSGVLREVEKDTDVLAFNSNMVALYVAAEILAEQGDAMAEAKSNMAESMRRAELYRQGPKKGGFGMMAGSGSEGSMPRLRYGIDYME